MYNQYKLMMSMRRSGSRDGLRRDRFWIVMVLVPLGLMGGLVLLLAVTAAMVRK